MKKLLATSALALSALFLAACDPVSPEVAAIPKQQSISVAAIASTAKGFQAGKATAKKVAYVFFDAQCPHCGHLWEASKPLWGQANFVWIPVAFLNKASMAQGATLLGSDAPVARMDEHESLLLAHQGGITASPPAAELRTAIEKNTKLLASFGGQSIPFIVTTTDQGSVVSSPGAASTQALANFMGIEMNNAPAAALVAATPSTGGIPALVR